MPKVRKTQKNGSAIGERSIKDLSPTFPSVYK